MNRHPLFIHFKLNVGVCLYHIDKITLSKLISSVTWLILLYLQ